MPFWLARLNGIVSWRERLPPLPASYVLTAFAVDDFNGLNLAEESVTVSLADKLHNLLALYWSEDN